MSTKWFVYILLCKDNSLYTGVSPDPRKRFEEHKAGGGGAYTRSHKPMKLLYVKKFSSKSKALKRELQIKKMPKSTKIGLLKLRP